MAKKYPSVLFFCERSSKIKNITCNKTREFSQFTDVTRKKNCLQEHRINDENHAI